MQKQVNKIENVAVSASAGSGKTFQLAHRYIGLVGRGISPQRICALTFSRKASSEIFDSIVRYLCTAASAPENAIQTSQHIGIPDMQCADFLRILRSFVNSLHALHISTLDSFVVRVIKAFPFELGISPELEVMETGSPDETEIMDRTIRQLFLSEQTSRKKFADAFRQATFGMEEKQLETTLDRTILAYTELYLTAREQTLWSPEEILWTNTKRKYELLTTATLHKIAEELNEYVEYWEFKKENKEKFQNLIRKVSRFSLQSGWDRDYEKFMSLIKKVNGDDTVLTWLRQKHRLSKKEYTCLNRLIKHIIAVEIKRAIEQTHGTWLLLDAIDKIREKLRRDGSITLVEAQLLLSPDKYPAGLALTRNPLLENRLYIDYRLNCSLDHWLIDEFQDTSDLQWSVLSNIIDEVIQDDSGTRSFFYVGDPKQAIYGWRGGNARLFNRILQRYTPHITLVSLTKSYRSTQPIIDTVNRVFNNLPDEVSETVRTEWNQLWTTHNVATEYVPESGYAVLIEAERITDGRKRNEQQVKCLEILAEILRKINPIELGLSTAVLVRTNKIGKKVVDFLRTACPEMLIVHEGKGEIMDNAVVPLIMALVRISAHPEDTMSWMHLRMGPLSAIINEMWQNRPQSTLDLLYEIHKGGFQKFVRKWSQLLAKNSKLHAFEIKRLNDLALAAGIFDTTGSRDCNRFIKFIENYEAKETASEKCVRVMTVHQAKGLEFDIVILSEIGERSWQEVKSDFLIATNTNTDTVKWILKMPHKIVLRSDAQLREELERQEADSFLEELRLFYVAMTRAKRALYMVIPPASERSTAFHSARLLRIQLTGKPVSDDDSLQSSRIIYEHGDSEWYEKISPNVYQLKTHPSITILSPDYITKTSPPAKFVKIEPAKQTISELNGQTLFAISTWEAIELGNAVHNIMQKIEWWNKTEFENLVNTMLSTARANDTIFPKAIRICKAALDSDEIQNVFKKPDGNVELWREKSFEVIVGNRLISGRFDRVMITKNSDGKPVSAVIVDFKTEHIENIEQLRFVRERYKNQIQLYLEALSRMLGMPEKQCRVLLVLTSIKKVILANTDVEDVLPKSG